MIIDKYIYVVAFNGTAAVRCGKDMSIDDNLCPIRDNCGIKLQWYHPPPEVLPWKSRLPTGHYSSTAAVMSDLIGA